MSRLRFVALALALVVTAVPALRADVKTQEKTQISLGGMLGRMMGMFGGKAAKDGIVSMVAVKGNRKMTVDENTGEIIDLDEQQVYQIDMKDKSYRVVTFAEMKRQMEEARAKAEQSAREAQAREQPEQAERKPEQEIEIDFDLKETGQRRSINGYDCREVLMTVTVREKGRTLEQAGGMVMATSMWLAPTIAALDEIAQFDLRYARAVYGDLFMPSAEQMTAAMAMYPMMQQAMERFQQENVNMEGTALLTEMKFDAVASAEQAKQAAEEDQPSARGGVGGLMGGLGRRVMRRNQQADETPGRATVMTTRVEYVSIQPSATDADVSLPAGFKQK